MGNSQNNSEEKIKSLFHQINFLCNPNSLFEKDFLIECQNIKKILLNEISNGAYLFSPLEIISFWHLLIKIKEQVGH